MRRKLKLISRGFIARKITETITISEGFTLTYTSIHLVLLCCMEKYVKTENFVTKNNPRMSNLVNTSSKVQ